MAVEPQQTAAPLTAAPTANVGLRSLMPLKSLLIDLTPGSYRYIFKGTWTGNDVRLALKNLFREYRLYNREIRRTHIQEVNKEIGDART